MSKAQRIVDEIEARIMAECKEADYEDRYEDFLNEVGQGDLRGMFSGYRPADVLKEVDPVAYRSGLSDWLDGECSYGAFVYVGSGYYDPEEVEEVAREVVDGYADKLADMEADFDDMESEVADLAAVYEELGAKEDYVALESAQDRLDALEAAIELLREEISAAESQFDL